jgi:hypothetical protein
MLSNEAKRLARQTVFIKFLFPGQDGEAVPLRTTAAIGFVD